MNESPPPVAADVVIPTRPRDVSAWLWFGVMLALAAAIRAWLASTPEGHRSDLDIFTDWVRRLQAGGLAEFYAGNKWCDYPPLMVLVFDAVGRAATAILGAKPISTDLWMVWKAPACIADLLIGVLLMLEGRRLFGSRAGLAAAALYLLNPVSIYDSAFWGQVDSIYTLFLLAGLVMIGRGGWFTVGLVSAIAVLTKFQAIAILPLLIFETYRIGGWRGLGVKLVGAVVAAAAVLSPFYYTGTLEQVLTRSYVNVVGQYHEMSKNAFNLWWLAGDPESADTRIPAAIVAAVAQGETSLAADASPLLWLNWRKISLGLYALIVAVIISIYSRRPGSVRRYCAAGILALAFFLFPTEMHERYAFPAVAFLGVWAVARAVNERLYVLICALLLINLAAALPPLPLGMVTASGLLACFFILLFLGLRCDAVRKDTTEQDPRTGPADPIPAGPRRLIPLFRTATVVAVVGAVGATGYVVANLSLRPVRSMPDSAIFLSDLAPRSARQGWKSLAADASVAGGYLRLGDRIYLKGLGTHAPARLEYAIPAAARRFSAVVGVNRDARLGSVLIAVEVDGKVVATSGPLTAESPPFELDVPVAGKRHLALVATDGGNGRKGDHVDWALARFLTE
ncbi:MAG: hypothetical protein AMXMBFR47_42180 [Planctomycetota bacterium]